MTVRPTRRGPRRRAGRGLALVLAAAALVLPLSGCGDLRLETPPPAPLVPDDDESARQRAVADALALATLADVAGRDLEGAALDALTTLGTTSRAHAEALGGVYVPVPGTPTDPAATSSPAPTAPRSAAADPQVVLDLLDESAASVRADAISVPDPALARLLASVAASRTVLGDLVARAADLDRVTVPTLEVPETLPTGVPASVTSALVQSEDALGLAWEVVAARSADGERASAAEQARAHRERAEAWARAGDLAGSGLDPRTAGYALPEALLGPTDTAAGRAAAHALERELAARYAAAVPLAPAGERTPFVTALVDATRSGWPGGTGPVPVLPGMPEVEPDVDAA